MSAARLRKQSHRLQRARAYLVRAILDNAFGPGGRLPPMTRLARDAGVSLVTMWKAVNALKREGLLWGAPGHRITVAGASPMEETAGDADEAPSAPPRGSGLQRVKSLLRRDLLSGAFPRTMPLPSPKELAGRYSVSLPPVQRALRALVDESLLVRRNRQFFVRPISAPHGTAPSRVVFVAYARTSVWQEIEWEYWHTEFLRQLEAECARARLLLDVYSFTEEDDGLRLRDNASGETAGLDDGPDVLGYLYLVRGPEGVRESLLNRLARTGKPLAIFDEVGGWTAPRAVLESPNAKIFGSTALRQPGETVGRYLLELGHRNVAYLSHLHAYAWSRRRLAGVRSEFEAAGVAGGLVTFAIDKTSFGDFVRNGLVRSDLAGFTRRFREEILAPLPPAYAPSFNSALSLMRFCAMQAESYHQMIPLFEQALARRDITAWIVATGKLGLSALDFLKRNRVRIPQELSVVSFDDIPECVPVRLTSYNFNFPAIMNAMLHFVINRQSFPVKKKTVEIEGFLIERQSTGPAPRGAAA